MAEQWGNYLLTVGREKALSKCCKVCGELWYDSIETCICGNDRFWNTTKDWTPKTVEVQEK